MRGGGVFSLLQARDTTSDPTPLLIAEASMKRGSSRRPIGTPSWRTRNLRSQACVRDPSVTEACESDTQNVYPVVMLSPTSNRRNAATASRWPATATLGEAGRRAGASKQAGARGRREGRRRKRFGVGNAQYRMPHHDGHTTMVGQSLEEADRW